MVVIVSCFSCDFRNDSIDIGYGRDAKTQIAHLKIFGIGAAFSRPGFPTFER